MGPAREGPNRSPAPWFAFPGAGFRYSPSRLHIGVYSDPMRPLAPLCPRCGYDQSGVAATWQGAGVCPLAGTCSECGEAFEWADLFNPRRRVLRGFFEHARGWRRLLTWSQITFLWTLLPWVFWRRVGSERYPLRRRALLWPLAACVPFYVVGSLVWTAGLVVWAVAWAQPSAVDWVNLVNCWLGPVARVWLVVPAPWYGLRFDPGRWLLLGAPMLTLGVVFPLILLLLNRLPAGAGLPIRPILRAAIYSFAWVPAAGVFRLAHALWWLARRVDEAIGGAPGIAALPQPPFSGIALAVAGGTIVWFGVWWWCALAAMTGRRNALRFWLAGALPAAAIGALVLARVQILIAQR